MKQNILIIGFILSMLGALTFWITAIIRMLHPEIPGHVVLLLILGWIVYGLGLGFNYLLDKYH